MRIILMFFSFLLLGSQAVSYGQTISLADITAGAYRPKDVLQAISSKDGQYFFLSENNNTQIIKYSYKTGLPVVTMLDLQKAKGIKLISFQGFSLSPDEKTILLYDDSQQIYRRSFKASYYCYDTVSKYITQLTNSNEKQYVPIFSPNSENIAYVIDNNIWIYSLKNKKHTQVTTDGVINKIINGSTDWVYEEEFTTISIMSFSPDSKYLAFVRFDESNVKEFSFQTFKGKLYPETEVFKYPKAGEDNSKVSCIIYDIENKQNEKIDLLSDNIEYIPRIDFVSNKNLAIMTLNRNQNDFKMYYYDLSNKKSRLVFEEKNQKYIDSDFIKSLKFIFQGFLYISERDGYSHIYLYNTDGSLNRQLTKGNFDVTQMLAYDTNSNTIFFQAADISPLERNIFKFNLKNNTQTKISRRIGYNNASFSNNAQFFINNWSDVNTPNRITLNSAISGDEIRVLEDNKELVSKLASISKPTQEFIKVKVADGTDLNAYILKPYNFDETKRYPLLMVQYSGPNSQQVLNEFGIDWTSYLVDQGYIVAAVDGRGTGARGEDFRKSTYLNLGIYESDDQISAAKYLKTLPYVDSDNVSIWGWSFGGYNVLMSLSRSKGVFKNGIAIAPVTDWRFYDSVYTERYMQTPQDNKDGYDNGSPLKQIDGFSANLLLIHGSADDNVHYQNSVEYISALIDNGKQFDVFVFPDLNHSLLGSSNRHYLYTKIIDFLKKNKD